MRMEQWQNRYMRSHRGPLLLSALVSIVVVASPVEAANDEINISQNDATNSSATPPLAPSYEAAADSSHQDGASLLSDLTTLEYRLFAKDYPEEDVQRRLDRLERVVFGSRRSGAVDERVANLMREVAIAPTSPVADSGGADGYSYNTTGAAIATADQPTSLLEVAANMETEVFGKTYPRDTLMTRVARLEKSVLPKGSEQSLTPLPVRIHNLLVALQPKIQYQGVHNQNPYLQAAQSNQSYSYATPSTYSTYATPSTYSYSTTSTNSNNQQLTHEKKDSNGHPLMKKLGQILEGVGTVAGATLGSMAATSAMYGPYGYGYPGFYGGWGPYYGYGYSPFGYRW
ncbi:MAG: hypothetical protein K2W95_13620 [Candidatus Obscuribacterales bacterium]|nr:hypothetical protein [Candidatus Obscuribacterales bacterium]